MALIPRPWGQTGPPALVRASVPLRVIDRCDRCGARAQVRATKLMSVLLFCGFHARGHRGALVGQGWRVEEPNNQSI